MLENGYGGRVEHGISGSLPTIMLEVLSEGVELACVATKEPLIGYMIEYLVDCKVETIIDMKDVTIDNLYDELKIKIEALNV